MKALHICVQCAPDTFNVTAADYFDEGIAIVRCPVGHETAMVVQGIKAEFLLSSAANALLQGFTFEAVASASAALERYYEFALKVFFAANEMSDLFAETFKGMAAQSERQLGAFMLVSALAFGDAYSPDQEMTRFRNSVIHRGQIPNPEEARKFCKYVFDTVSALHGKLAMKFAQRIPLTAMFELGERQRKHVPKGMRVSTIGMRHLFDMSRSKPQSFDEAMKEFAEAQKMLAEVAALPQPVHKNQT